MKELVYSRIEIFFLLLSSMLTYFIGQVAVVKQEQIRVVSPFYIDFSKDTDPDNNLSGNSGIAEDYYVKQIRQFFNKDL